MIKAYDSKNPPKPVVTMPMPALSVRTDLEFPMVIVVDSDGKNIGNLHLTRASGAPCDYCQSSVAAFGYSTDWAEWTENGAFIKFK